MQKVSWKETIPSLAIGFILLIATYLTAANGHGTFLLAKIAFPYTMLSTTGNEPISSLYILLALLQYPLYNYIYLINNKNSIVAIMLLVVHAIFVVLAFQYSSELFA